MKRNSRRKMRRTRTRRDQTMIDNVRSSQVKTHVDE